MKRIRILDLWFFRGFFYFYVGFITIEGDTTFNRPQDIIGLAQLAMGACYVLMVRGSMDPLTLAAVAFISVQT